MQLDQWNSQGLFRFEVGDSAFRQLIETVLTSIPDRDGKTFLPFAILQGDSNGTWAHVDTDIIIFDVDEMNRLSLDDDVKTGVIAHELAHFSLGHIDAQDDEEASALEDEADNKTGEWGFERQVHRMRDAITSACASDPPYT